MMEYKFVRLDKIAFNELTEYKEQHGIKSLGKAIRQLLRERQLRNYSSTVDGTDYLAKIAEVTVRK